MNFLGMKGSGQFTADELPQDWAQQILFEYPNGQTPIFAIQSMFPEQLVLASEFNWWTETMPARSGALTDVYIDAGLATPYVYATHQATKGIAGATVYVKMAEALATDAVIGHTCALINADRPTATVRGRVVSQSLNGASSYIAVQLIEADDNAIDGDGASAASSYNLATADRIIYMAGAYPWGSSAPEALSYTPTKFTNYTQVGRDVFSLSESAQAQITRTGDIYDNDKIRLMYRHAQGWEWSAIFGHKYSTSDIISKQPLYYTEGLLDFVLTNNASMFQDYRYATDELYAGKDWVEAGHKFIRNYFKILRRFAPDNVFVLCGDGAAAGMEELAETYGHVNVEVGQKDYGLEVSTWRTFSGSFPFKIHPLLSRESSTNNLMIFYVPENMRLCPLVNNGKDRRTKFETGMVTPGVDGTVDGFKTEAGWKFEFPNQFMILDGIGLKNSVS